MGGSDGLAVPPVTVVAQFTQDASGSRPKLPALQLHVSAAVEPVASYPVVPHRHWYTKGVAAGSITMPCYFHVGAPLEGGVKVGADIYEGNAPKYVAFRADGYTKENPAAWYAEIIAFVCPIQGNTAGDPHAFARWLEEDQGSIDDPVR
jgi:hypothetical protein